MQTTELLDSLPITPMAPPSASPLIPHSSMQPASAPGTTPRDRIAYGMQQAEDVVERELRVDLYVRIEEVAWIARGLRRARTVLHLIAHVVEAAARVVPGRPLPQGMGRDPAPVQVLRLRKVVDGDPDPVTGRVHRDDGAATRARLGGESRTGSRPTAAGSGGERFFIAPPSDRKSQYDGQSLPES